MRFTLIPIAFSFANGPLSKADSKPSSNNSLISAKYWIPRVWFTNIQFLYTSHTRFASSLSIPASWNTLASSLPLTLPSLISPSLIAFIKSSDNGSISM